MNEPELLFYARALRRLVIAEATLIGRSLPLLGRVALKSLVLADGKAELAYWMVPSARGAGLCPSAVMVLTRWALGQGRFHRIELEHSTANRASCRVAVKAGFEKEGVRRGAWLHADGWHDVHLHARIRGDERSGACSAARTACVPGQN
ncbi:GNAT family N-acetyltransferase [Streptomyces sp. NPDC019443]|uniref:GNAT family N-acetyltransferase n=1 Tax=Streptomyces sp. NPDC019443 TaxID=3365061 RepID=UPI0037A230CF